MGDDAVVAPTIGLVVGVARWILDSEHNPSCPPLELVICDLSRQCCTKDEVAFWCWGSKRKREADGGECREEEVSLGVRARAR